MLHYLRTHLFLQLPFRLLSTLPAVMLLSPAILTHTRAMAKAMVDNLNFILMTLVALLTLMFAWHHYTLCHMAINEVSLIMVQGN